MEEADAKKTKMEEEEGKQRKVHLIPYDCEETFIEISEKAASQCDLLSTMIEDDEDDGVIKITMLKINQVTLERIGAFLRYHENDPMKKIPEPLPCSSFDKYVCKWDDQFTFFQKKDNEKNTLVYDIDPLIEIYNAADYLDIKPLRSLIGARVASIIRTMNPDDVSRLIGRDPVTEEQAREVRNDPEYKCIFD